MTAVEELADPIESLKIESTDQEWKILLIWRRDIGRGYRSRYETRISIETAHREERY